MLDTVMRFGLHASPHLAVSTSITCNTASALSIGSPIPINTTLVSVSVSGMLIIWLMISAGVRLPWNPCRPVMQKVQPMRQPFCDEMHRVARSPSGIYTLSTAFPSLVAKRYFTVPSMLRCSCIGAYRPTV